MLSLFPLQDIVMGADFYPCLIWYNTAKEDIQLPVVIGVAGVILIGDGAFLTPTEWEGSAPNSLGRACVS